MSSLSDKAKTRAEITQEECNYSCRTAPPYKGWPKPDKTEEWVRLEDAEEEIAKLQERLEAIRKHHEEYPRVRHAFCPHCKTIFDVVNSFNENMWLQKLGILLGENK